MRTKKLLLFIIIALIFVGCSSIKNHNAHVNDLIAIEHLKSDVDFASSKMKALHPNLYWYISKDQLDHKFDSLKTTITQPITSFEFYKKISPIVASVRQGHMSVVPNNRIMTKKEREALVKKGIGPFSQFEFNFQNDKMYVVKNKSDNKTIQLGSEVLFIEGKTPSELTQNYSRLFTSDGFNQTYKIAHLNRNFPNYYTTENGIKDSLRYEFKFKDTLTAVTIKRKIIDSLKNESSKEKKKAAPKLTQADKLKKQEEKKKNKIFGYNFSTGNYNRNLSFKGQDSSIAVMKIRAFSIGNAKAFYKQSFAKMKENNSKTLILDLRDNPGGSLSEIVELYSYLVDSTFIFSKKSEVATKTSILHADYFKNSSLATKAIKAIVSPLYVGFMFFKVHKDSDGKFYYATSESRTKKSKTDAFHGKIYVLINGGSFSAACIISSNLQGSKRAFFVGQETGGAYNGTVAGQMPLVKLPNSKIKIRIGLMAIKPFYQSEIEGRGIFPDKEIIPTLEDKIHAVDVEMNWVLDTIKNAPSEKSKSE